METEEPSAADADTTGRALLKAAEIVGGITPLHLYLKVDRSELCAWLAGKGAPPQDTFLRVVEVLIDPDAAQDIALQHARLRGPGRPGDEDNAPPE